MNIEKLENLINQLEVTKDNKEQIEEMRRVLSEEKYEEMFAILEKLKRDNKIILKNKKEKAEKVKQEIEEYDDEDEEEIVRDKKESIYPKELQNKKLEEKYICLLLANPKALSMYYIMHDDNYFESDVLLNIYKSVLFTDGEAYAPEKAKDGYNFAKEGGNVYETKITLREKGFLLKDNFEKVYTELRKLFEIRKSYLSNPIKENQDEIVNILNYELYKQMTIQEVKDAIEQINATEKFKRSVLNNDTTDFLIQGDNSLTTGLDLPFPILSSVFKGIRKGETMSYAMPSNSGKSRLTVDLAAYIAFIHKGKMLFVEEKDVLLDNYRILKCSKDDFENVDSDCIVGLRKSPYGVEALVLKEKINPVFNLEKPTIEDIIVFMAKEAK